MEEKKKIQAGKAYESLSDKEREQIVGFTEEQHTEMRARCRETVEDADGTGRRG